MTHRFLRATRATPPSANADRPWYGVVALPPTAVAERLRGLQQDIGIPRGEPQPHITLKMPFQLKASLSEVKDRIAEVTRRMMPLVVTLHGIGRFAGPYNNAIYATVQRNQRLQTLHSQLVLALADAVDDVYPYSGEIERESYVPHMTIASDLSEAEMEEGLQRLGGVSLRARFIVDRVQLMRREAPGRWRIARTFPLGRADANAHVSVPRRATARLA